MAAIAIPDLLDSHWHHFHRGVHSAREHLQRLLCPALHLSLITWLDRRVCVLFSARAQQAVAERRDLLAGGVGDAVVDVARTLVRSA